MHSKLIKTARKSVTVTRHFIADVKQYLSHVKGVPVIIEVYA